MAVAASPGAGGIWRVAIVAASPGMGGLGGGAGGTRGGGGGEAGGRCASVMLQLPLGVQIDLTNSVSSVPTRGRVISEIQNNRNAGGNSTLLLEGGDWRWELLFSIDDLEGLVMFLDHSFTQGLLP